jgi:hypothetical protein
MFRGPNWMKQVFAELFRFFCYLSGLSSILSHINHRTDTASYSHYFGIQKDDYTFWRFSGISYMMWKLNFLNINSIIYGEGSCNSLVGIVMGYELDGWRVRVWFLAEARDFSLHHIQSGSRVHPASYPVGSWTFFPEGKVTGLWSWPFTSNRCWG